MIVCIYQVLLFDIKMKGTTVFFTNLINVLNWGKSGWQTCF